MSQNGNAVKTVEIELGGETRRMALTLNAIVAFEESTHRDIMKADTSALEDLTVKEMRTLLTELLRSCDRELTEDQVGSWIDIGNLGYVTERISLLMKIALPGGEGGATSGNPSPAPTGGPSTG